MSTQTDLTTQSVTDEIEKHLKKGNPPEARRLLDRATKAGKLVDAPVERVANLLWRLGEPMRGLRALSKVIDSPDEALFSEHPEQACEYAACLMRLGNHAEALWVLSLEGVRDHERAILYRAYTAVETWDCASAITEFRKCLADERAFDPYTRRVALANFASCLAYEKEHREAKAVLGRLLHDSRLAENRFLLGYVFEVAAVNLLLARDFKESDKFIGEAAKQWREVDGADSLILRKWSAILALFRKGDAASVAEVTAVREAARQNRLWETVRDCDRYLGVSTGDRDILSRLYFGTPFVHFRRRLVREVPAFKLPAHFELRLGEGQKKNPPLVRVLVDNDERERLALSKQSLTILAALASDGYRPFRLSRLFAATFVDEHFHPIHSPPRMHQALKRFHVWLKESGLPLEVEETNAEYRLTASAPLGLLLPHPEDKKVAWNPIDTRLKERFGDQWFSVSEAAEGLDLPRRTALRQIQTLGVSKKIETKGVGRATRYRCAG